MAANAAPFSVLPQFQGNLYDLQTKQAIAQALIQKGLEGDLKNYQPAGGGFAYVPKYGAGAIAAQLGNALLGNTLQQEAGQGLTQLGQQQAAAFQQMFAPQVQPRMTGAEGIQGGGAEGMLGGGGTGVSPTALGNALAPQPARMAQSPLNPMGMSPAAAGFLAQTMGLPAFAEKFIAPSYTPTDTTKMAMQAGMTPAQIQAANAGRIAQQNSMSFSPGQTVIINGQERVIPNIGEGMEEVTRSDGSKLIIPRQGYTSTVGAIEGARALGRAQGELVEGTQGGLPAFRTKAEVIQGGGAQQGPSTGRFGGYQALGGEPFRPGLSPAEQEGQIGIAKGNVGMYNALKDTASNSAERTNILDSLEAYANGRTTFGPGWTGRIENLAAINSKLPSGMSFGSNDVSNAQVVQKLASNLIQQYQKSMGGTGTDKQFELVMHGTPGADMTNKAMQEVIPKLKSMEIALQAKANAADSWLAANNNNPASLNKFETTWRQNYDPRIYQMSMMTPDQRNAFMSQQKDAAALKTKVQTALNNGWVQ